MCAHHGVLTPHRYVSEPGAELIEKEAEKTWVALESLRAVPPEPPSDWLRKLLPYDVISAVLSDQPNGSGWVEAAFQELVLPLAEDDKEMASVLSLDTFAKYTLPASALRPLWSLASETNAWSMSQRRSGPRSAVLLTFRRSDTGAVSGAASSAALSAASWRLDAQLTLRGDEAATGESGEPPAAIEKVAAKAADDPNLLTVQLTQQDGSWSFAGDGRASFVPPLAPLPVDENPQARRWSKGDRVEVGPVDEAYVGSWYAGQIAAFAGGNQGGEAGTVKIQYDTLTNEDGTPLTEWQPLKCLRPRPPGMIEGVWPPSHFDEGDLLQVLVHEGWWECIVVPPPAEATESKKEAKQRRKREAERQAAAEAAEAAGEEPSAAAAAADGASDTKLRVKLLYSSDVLDVTAGSVRPAWVLRTGDWFWRVKGGVLQHLTTRMSDGKAHSQGYIKPMWKKGIVPSSILLNVRLEGDRWELEPPGVDVTDLDRSATAQWLANLTLVPAAPPADAKGAAGPAGLASASSASSAEPNAKAGSAKGRRASGADSTSSASTAERSAAAADSSKPASKPASASSASYVAHSGHVRRVIGGSFASDEATPAAAFAPRQTVEVLQEDEGFEGAYYGADVLEVLECCRDCL